MHRGGISMSGDGHIIPNYEFVLANGFGGMREIAKQHLQNDQDLSEEQIAFYAASIITMDAALRYCKRFAKRAKEEAHD